MRDLMAREEVGGSLRNQRSPILVVEGFRGAGKTALLSELYELLDQRVPRARLDFEANKRASVPQVLSALAFELSTRCPRYRLQFPRFIVGQLVMGLELDQTHREQAYREVAAALGRQRGVDTFRDVLVAAAGEVLGTMFIRGLPVEAPGKDLLERILTWLTVLAPEAHRPLPFQQWYGHQDLHLPKDAIDVLVDLNRWHWEAADKDSRRRVDDLLWAAFLADLRTEFDRGRRADERSLNCVVLLDNADTVLGRRFLTELVRTRRQRTAGGPDDADPLTVVATSRGALLADVPSTNRALVPTDNTGSWPLRRIKDRSLSWWLQYRLPDLTEDEVGRAVAALGRKVGNNEILTQVIFGLTGGHPASTSLVLDAIDKNPPENVIEPEVTLSQTLSGDGPSRSTVEAQMLDRLLDVSDATRRDLVTCAAARQWPHAVPLPLQGTPKGGGRAKYLEILEQILWPADETAGPALLRRLLQRRLALRTPPVAPSWSDVYGQLRDSCRTKDDESGELYYALAGGELEFVTQRLHQRIAELEDKRWLKLLTSVTAAPRQHRQQQALVDEAHRLVRAAALAQPLISLARLIAALWIAADPFIDSNRSDLHIRIADDYTEVARLTPNAPSAVLLQESRRHQREAERWS
ncbi:MAG TPA: hypothetical protein VIY28_14605 [Pseudonocardiaceae bacterium]